MHLGLFFSKLMLFRLNLNNVYLQGQKFGFEREGFT